MEKRPSTFSRRGGAPHRISKKGIYAGLVCVRYSNRRSDGRGRQANVTTTYPEFAPERSIDRGKEQTPQLTLTHDYHPLHTLEARDNVMLEVIRAQFKLSPERNPADDPRKK